MSENEKDYAESLAETIAEHAVIWGRDDEDNDVPLGFDVNVLRTLMDAAIKGSVDRALAKQHRAICEYSLIEERAGMACTYTGVVYRPAPTTGREADDE